MKIKYCEIKTTLGFCVYGKLNCEILDLIKSNLPRIQEINMANGPEFDYLYITFSGELDNQIKEFTEWRIQNILFEKVDN